MRALPAVNDLMERLPQSPGPLPNQSSAAIQPCEVLSICLHRLRVLRHGLLAIVLSLFFASSAHAYFISVDIDTSTATGLHAHLAMDLIRGDSGVTNTATITGFETDSEDFVPEVIATFGDVSGSLADTLVLGNGEFFNSFEQYLQLGTFIRFSLEISENDSTGGLFPDRLSLYLLDYWGSASWSSYSVVATTDPTGADAFFGIDFTGNPGGLEVYSATSAPFLTWNATVLSTETPAPVPEPGVLWLVTLGLFALGWASRRNRIRRDRQRVAV